MQEVRQILSCWQKFYMYEIREGAKHELKKGISISKTDWQTYD